MLSLMWCWSDLMTITATRFSTLSKRCFQFSPSCSYYHCHFSQQIIRYRPSGRPQPALTCSYVNPSLHPSPHLSLFWSPVLFEVEVKRWEFISSYATPLNLLISQGFQSTGVFRSTAFGHGCRFPRPSFPKQRSFFFPSIPPSPYPLHEVSDLSLSSSSSLVLKQHQELLRGRSILTPTGLERGFAEMREPQEEKLKKKKIRVIISPLWKYLLPWFLACWMWLSDLKLAHSKSLKS